MSRVQAEALAASKLREWLLMALPAKVTTVNSSRKSLVRCPRAGPYTLPPMTFTVQDGSSAPVSVVVSGIGTPTAADIAADINSAVGYTFAYADADGRWYIQTDDAPVDGTPSHVAVGGDASLSNFGWPAGGEESYRVALLPPTSNTICDGRPIEPDFGSGVLVIIDDRSSEALSIRSDQYNVRLELVILAQDTSIGQSRNREHIQATLQAVRECLLQDRGRQLGAESSGIQLVTETDCAISGAPFKLTDLKVPNDLFDSAFMTLNVRIHERPDAT